MIFVNSAHLLALRTILAALQDLPHAWALTGSTGMALQGLPLEVHDIDLQTDQDGAYAIQQCLAQYVVTPVRWVASERMRSYLGMLEVAGVQVEVMGDIQKRLADGTWEAPVRVEVYRQWVELEGFQVPVLSLEYEVQAYLKLGRLEKAELLRAWLDK